MQLNSENLPSVQNKSWYKKWWGILLFVIGTLTLIILVAFSFYVANQVKKIKSNKTIEQKLFNNLIYTDQARQAIEGQDNYWLGSTKPKVTIVEFADFSCPYCKNSFTKIREISLKYKNDVKIIFRDYPAYEHSLDLAMAARCAGEQGLFWLMHDKLFQNQGVYEKTHLLELANQIGADTTKFNNCLTNKTYLQQIQQNFADGQNLGVTGTPTWFINGNKIAGDIPYELFVGIVEKFIRE